MLSVGDRVLVAGLGAGRIVAFPVYRDVAFGRTLERRTVLVELDNGRRRNCTPDELELEAGSC